MSGIATSGEIALPVAMENAREILEALAKVEVDWGCQLAPFTAQQLMGAWFKDDAVFHENLRDAIVRQPSYWLGQLEAGLTILYDAVTREMERDDAEPAAATA